MKRVFLTGASAGIGRAIAGLLTENDYEVWGTARSAEKLPHTRNFHPVELDLNDMDSIHSALADALAESGGLDVLINNAGSGVYTPLGQLSSDALTTQFQTLVVGPMEITKLLLPGMLERHQGTVINVTSLAGQFPVPYMGAYSACKSALSSLSWTLEMELCQEPIRIVDLMPGDICTDFHRRMECHEILDEAGPDENMTRAYRRYTANMEAAPSPEIVARKVLRILDSAEKTPPPQITTGTFFQAEVAPLLAKVSPIRLTRFVLRKYYGLKNRRS